MTARNRIAQSVRRLRTAQGLGVRALATKAGASHSAVSLIEHSKRTPSIDLLDRLAAALGVDVADLLGGEAA